MKCKKWRKTMEMWETIPKYPNYEVSNLGNVRGSDNNEI